MRREGKNNKHKKQHIPYNSRPSIYNDGMGPVEVEKRLVVEENTSVP